MRKTCRLAMGLMLVFPLVACEKEGAETDEVEFTPKDSAAVRVEIEKWRTTMLAQDFDGWATSVTSDVVLYPPNAKPAIGRDAAVAFVKAYPKTTKFDIVVDELTGRGDLAHDRGTYVITANLPDGTTINDTGSFVSIFRRQPDGTWPHSRVMWHSDSPPPPAPAATTRPRTSGR